MIKRAEDMVLEQRTNVRGGEGAAVFSHMLSGEELPGKCRLISTITLEPDASIGKHTHEEETEVYHILQGFAEYNDNGKMCTLEEGDTTSTPSGQYHAITNIGEDDLVFLAMIVLD